MKIVATHGSPAPLALAAIVDRHLQAVLGWRRVALYAGLLPALPRYARRFARPTDDAGLAECKRRFLLAGALYHELTRRVGAAAAERTMLAMLSEIAELVQRGTYLSPPNALRSWDAFHAQHEEEARHGVIRHNVWSERERSQGRYAFAITRCCFYEAFRDMGAPALTEAFCRSDEIVYNAYSPDVVFHRGSNVPNTIARGAERCTFVFERPTSARPPPSDSR